MVASACRSGVYRWVVASAVVAVGMLGLVLTESRATASVIGNWDFSTGSFAPVSGMPGMQLAWLPDTSLYAAFGGTPNPPPLVYATTGSFGVAALGSGNATVLRVPDMRGRGPAVGMMASFPLLANGTTSGGAPLTKLNRYTFVTDVLVPESTFTNPTAYLDLFQPRGNADGSLFVRKPSQELGAAVAYGGQIAANAWYRIVMVMQLDAATSAPRYDTYINGQPTGQIIWDQIVVDSNRNADLKGYDLLPDGGWSIAALSETQSSLPANASGFFAFNDDSGEVGELYVANMQFRDDALSAADVAALGGAAPGPIAVPEPTTLGILAAAAVAVWSMRVCPGHRVDRLH
ncbi:MAG: PEP-CTERM sorting domain-containing protein [Planctomycetia bacterium]|nr:PEP-CTERM sorting domain-containing protein [Planctomycetia bacterium]